MWDSSHIHTYHSIKQIVASQSPLLKSLTSTLEPTLWGSVSKPTRDYRTSSNTICNDPRKCASHICTISQKDQSLLRLFVVVNKAQIYPVNTRCGTHYTPTHITQSIKLGYHSWNVNSFQNFHSTFFFSPLLLLQSSIPSFHFISQNLMRTLFIIFFLTLFPSSSFFSFFSIPFFFSFFFEFFFKPSH